MKKKSVKHTDTLRPNYDFSGGVRGKYARTLKENGYTVRVYRQDGTFREKRVLGENSVTLEPDVRKYFPTAKAVNKALRTLITLIPQKNASKKLSAAGGRNHNKKRTLKA